MPTAAADGRITQKRNKRRHPRLNRQFLEQTDPTVTRDEVLAALETAVRSADFPATARNRRFLEYVVRHALDGELEKISGYHVATEVFGRAPDFDPTTDPIVRIEAAKLRRDLETYYLKDGSRAAVRIALPRGGYLPIFQRAVAAESGGVLDYHAVTVHALHGANGTLPLVGPSLRARVVDLLARESNVSVFAGPATASADGLLDSDTARDLARRNGTRFVLSGDGRPDGDAQFIFTARLHDGHTGRLLWSEDIAGSPDTLHEALVVRALAAQREWSVKLAAVSAGPDLPA